MVASMFSWICPKCGADVPPSEDDCPRCAKIYATPVLKEKKPDEAPQKESTVPPEPVSAHAPTPHTVSPPRFAPAVAQPSPPPPPPLAPQPQTQPAYTIPPPRQRLPSWLIVVLVFAGLTGAGWVAYTYVLPINRGEQESAAKLEPKLVPLDTAKKKQLAHPFARHLEVTGLRITEGANRKLDVRMVVVNHSAAELPDLKLQVELSTVNAKPGAEPISVFTAAVPPLSAFESKDVKAPATTRLRAYEFPDWQFLKADFTVLSP